MPRLDHNERLIIGLTLALKLGVLLLGLGAWQLVHGSGAPPFPGWSCGTAGTRRTTPT